MNEPKTFLRKRVYGVQVSEFPQNRVRLIEVIRRLVLSLLRKKDKNLIIKAVTEWNGSVC